MEEPALDNSRDEAVQQARDLILWRKPRVPPLVVAEFIPMGTVISLQHLKLQMFVLICLDYAS